MASTVRDRLHKEIDRMSDAQMEKLLQTVSSGTDKQRGLTVGEAIDRFAGLIHADELDRMEAAIEEGCEQVYPDDRRSR